MPSTYKTPGVYIEEISKFPPSVAQVETAIPAFIGYTQKAIFRGRDLHAESTIEPVRITSLLEYRESFGTAAPEIGITVTIEEQIDANSPPAVLGRQVTGAIAKPSPHSLYYAMQAFFANGGGPCYIVSVGSIANAAGVITPGDLVNGINEVAKEDEVTLFVFPESHGLSEAGRTQIFGDALNQCGLLQDRFVIMSVPVTKEGGVRQAAENFRDMSLPLDNLKYGAAYLPDLETVFNYEYDPKTVTLKHQQILLSSTPQDGEFNDQSMAALEPAEDNAATGNAVLLNLVKAAIDEIPLTMAPDALVAGQYANVDSTRGVFKAPANVALTSVIRPAVKISSQQQEGLNVDTSGKSINAIRSFVGKGTLIWGARTLAGNDNEWRYIPVRRFFNMAEESIKKATEGFVFEPNDANTWTKVKAMIENFLILQWRAGALAGAKPEQSFYVKVGLNETMTALDILEGRMIVEIGMAVVRPAEFIILKFSHKMQES